MVDRLDRVTARRSETAFLPSLALSAQASGKLTFFARYQEGFRPGGLAVSGPFVNRFESDDVAAFEAGMRYGLPGRGPIDLSASIAYTRWNDVQADLVDMAGFPSTANIGDGRIHTLDLKAGWRPIAGLSAEFSAVFNDSRLSDPRSGFGLLAASSLPNVADINARLAVGYEARISDDMRLELGGSVRYAGTSRLGIGPVLDQPQGDWVEVDLGARLQRDSHALTIDVSNLLDTVGNRFAMGSPFTLLYGRQITPLRPRTLRIGWETSF